MYTSGVLQDFCAFQNTPNISIFHKIHWPIEGYELHIQSRSEKSITKKAHAIIINNRKNQAIEQFNTSSIQIMQVNLDIQVIDV